MRHPAAALGAALSIVALAGSVLAPASALAKAPAGPPVQQPAVTQPAFLGDRREQDTGRHARCGGARGRASAT